ncbi:rhomboid family intramembrane serine protease [Sphingobium yanoikuyae]|uniref:Rhomboid family intramembrane serine protease n=1 Tax=Sphingobium yanoikuyae TaxID=13690 RepID=A0AA42WWY9_SPHYA|nr:rhomboid family intramembrane serine protease [Sphingobium yanoikuyae]MDH2131717.1 rhomboid family intramembrane serine protease [Sphingobium yanoikuyae]MDH2149476.1 rhomboid family intramembrane serine protease [Sphingobium yanoikuyae]MDH2166874.1 rhomboid family intramembrane serine protease [Sphingobium yanoikuyae]
MKLPAGRTTNAIALVTFVLFLLLLATGQIDNAALLGGFMPARIGNPGLLDGMAAVPWWLTPLSCTFVHAGWLHIGFNLLMLLFCGRQVEHVLGRTGTLILYVAGAYAACFAQWAITPESVNPMVGASGAISAIIATYALLYSQQQVRRIGPLSANFVRVLWLAAAWITIQLMIGVATAGGLGDLGQIAIAAHIGGFLAGLALTRPLLRWRFRKRPQAIN